MYRVFHSVLPHLSYFAAPYTKDLFVGLTLTLYKQTYSAAFLCLCAQRYADAILLTVKGSPELLNNTQKAYFEKGMVNLLHLRLFQLIITKDLADIVQNADL